MKRSAQHPAADFVADFGPIATELYGTPSIVAEAARGPVGNGQETWFVTVATGDATHDLVIRRSAESGPLDWTDRRTEYEVLRWLEGHDLPTPGVPHFEPHGGRLNRSAIVMDRLPGHPLARDEQAARDRLAIDLGRFLARLHRLDQSASPLDTSVSAADATTRELDTWWHRYANDRAQPIPLMGALFAWLRAHRPDRDGLAVTLWGDPGPYNVLHEDGRVTALLDWELTHSGDPLEDLGAAVWATSSVADPELLIGAYEDETGVPVDRDALGWFTVFSTLTRAVMLVTGTRNLISGEAHAPSLAGLTLDLLPNLLHQAADAAGWPGPDPVEAAPDAQEQASLRPSPAETLAVVSRYLETDALAAADDRLLRRNLKNAAALLAATKDRLAFDAGVDAQNAAAIDATLRDLAEAGVPTSGTEVSHGSRLEHVAIIVESDPAFSAHRERVRRLLRTTLARSQAPLSALARLYGR